MIEIMTKAVIEIEKEIGIGIGIETEIVTEKETETGVEREKGIIGTERGSCIVTGREKGKVGTETERIEIVAGTEAVHCQGAEIGMIETETVMMGTTAENGHAAVQVHRGKRSQRRRKRKRRKRRRRRRVTVPTILTQRLPRPIDLELPLVLSHFGFEVLLKFSVPAFSLLLWAVSIYGKCGVLTAR